MRDEDDKDDPDAEYSEFVRRNNEAFMRHCVRIVGWVDAPDLLQGVLIVTLRRWSTLSDDEAARVAWVYKVIETRGWRMSSDLRQRWKRILPADDIDLPEEAIDDQRLSALALSEACLEVLGHDTADGTLFMLLEIGMPRAEIANLLGVSRDTLRARIRRLKAKLLKHGISLVDGDDHD